MSRSTLLVAGLLMLMVGSIPAFAGGENLLVGTWSLDLSKFTRPDPPQRVILTLADVGGGKYKATVNIVDHDGTKRYSAAIFKLDGTPAPVAGNADYSVASMTMPNRRTWVMGGGFKGHPANTRVWSLSDNGRHMIETVVWHTPDGTPRTRVDVWNRAK